MPKLLITGASGNLGRAIMQTFSTNASYQIQGWARNRLQNGKLKKVDLLDEKGVLKALAEFQPDIIVHCAAETRPDVVANQKEQSESLNVGATRILASYAASSSAFLIHISTDYVFDGTKPPYNEDDVPNPLNEYGKQKLTAETVVQSFAGKHGVILRVPVLFGPSEYIGETAVDSLLKPLLDRSKNAKIDHFCIRYPTHTFDIADAVAFLVTKYEDTPNLISGIFHWSSDKSMTKWEMVKTIAEGLDLSFDHLVADESTPLGNVTRPKNAALSCTRMQQLGFLHKHRYLSQCCKNLYSELIKGGSSS